MALLTEREKDYLRLIASDYSDLQIALELGLKESSIHTYVKRLLKKLGHRSRVGLAVYAVRQGLVGPTNR